MDDGMFSYNGMKRLESKTYVLSDSPGGGTGAKSAVSNYMFFVLACLLQSAIWQCLNNYDYVDAVFLSERLFAEGETVPLILDLFRKFVVT